LLKQTKKVIKMRNKLLLLAMGIALTAQTLMAQVPSYVPTDGLVGYWPFNGNANDESGNGNNGNVNGATLTTDRFGNENSAYSFNGTNGFINVANSLSLSPTNSISLCGWIKSRSTNFFDRIINKSHNVAQNYATYQLITRNASLSATPGFTLRFGTGNSQLSSDYLYSGDNIGNVYFDIWQFIVGTWDGTAMKFYQNGILISSTARTGLLNYTNGDLQFGKGLGGTGLPQFYEGEIDDIGIWNRALTQQEITNLYNANQCFTNITVTDTLIINVGQLSFNDPVTYANNITIAPNPASSQINISFNNITDLNGGTLKVINSLGQEVATTPIATSGTQSIMQLATWGGSGMYYVQIINPQGQIVDIKKIILQ
jgi:hypothetical protein